MTTTPKNLETLRRSVKSLAACSMLVLLAGTAMGQPVAGAEAGSANTEVLDGPPHNLPGHEQGDRAPEAAKPAEAAPKAEEREWFGGLSWWKWSRVTGDWGGARTSMEDKGITFAGSLTWEWSSVWDGGATNKASDRHMWDVNATFDTEKMLDLKGGTLYVDAYWTESSGGSGDVGDYQGISNIDTYEDRAQIAEVWYEQKLFDDVLRIKAGKMEANSEFAFVENPGDSQHASSGFSPTIAFMPSFPETATGLVAYVYPTKHVYVGAGWFDGSLQDGVSTGKRGPDQFFRDNLSSDWFLIAEVGFTWDQLAEKMGGGHVGIGGSYATGRLDTFAGDVKHGSSSVYVVAEQQICSAGDTEELKDKGINVFAQLGFGDEDINPVKTHLAAGLAFSGFCAARADDTAGVYVSFVDFSGADGAPLTGNETAIETYYKLQLTPAVSVSPDLQYIIDPSGDSGLDNALVGQLRLTINF
jgi:porin